MKRIYFDYAAMTPLDKRVAKEIAKYSSGEYANPSGWYKEGVCSKRVVDISRKIIATSIHAHPSEITFTSGGTEANNIAILGTIESLRNKGFNYNDMHVLVSAVEHSSVGECFVELARRGVVVEEIRVNKQGMIVVEDLERKIRENTVLVSVLFVNNETGVIQPIGEISKILKRIRRQREVEQNKLKIGSFIFFHVDAAQAMYLGLDTKKMGVDTLSMDGNKMYGPRGIGVLFVRRNVSITPIMFGGGQERGLRSGTENVPAIAGFAKSIVIADLEREKEKQRLTELKCYFVEELRMIRTDILVNGDGVDSSPHIVNISIPGIDNEYFVLQLDSNGIACSTKSSCLQDKDESRTLKAMGVDTGNSVRFSFGRNTSKRDVRKLLEIIARFV